MRLNRHVLSAAALAGCIAAGTRAQAQGFGTAAAKPRPWSRISFFTNSSRIDSDGRPTTVLTELSTAFSYQLPDLDESGAEYGADVRYSAYTSQSRPERASIYEAFVGARLGDGRVKLRAGHVWLTELGSLGALAGAVFEARQERLLPEDGRFRFGAFGGMEPQVLHAGYAPDVKKLGGYVAYDGSGARRHSAGYVMVRNGPLVERSAVTTSNYLPLGPKVSVYQAAEVDVQPPAGTARAGLAYFFSNARVTATDRVELQGTYNRGRSVDVRGLSDDILNGRPVLQTSIDGLLYESTGGRVTVEIVPMVRVYAGYSRDRTNHDAEPTNRTLVGGYASNVARSGFDLSASDSLMARPGGSFHSRYLSVGRQIRRRVYLSGDYSTSLSVVRFSRSDGIIVETRPHTNRISGTATAYLTRMISLIGSVEGTREDAARELRVMTGLTYRIR